MDITESSAGEPQFRPLGVMFIRLDGQEVAGMRMTGKIYVCQRMGYKSYKNSWAKNNTQLWM